MARKIYLCGTQGTGKTTVLKALQEKLPDYTIVTEVVRQLAKSGVEINENGNIDGQNRIFSTYSQILSQDDNQISDRYFVDVLAYTKWLADNAPSDEKQTWNTLLMEQSSTTALFDLYSRLHHDILVVYFPIEFDVVADGVRSVDNNFREEIDRNIQFILNTSIVEYIAVSGTVEERVAQILEALESLNVE